VTEPNVVEWVKEHLLPVVYWQQQVQRTKNPDLRKNYQAAYLRADKLLSQHPVTTSLCLSDREHWLIGQFGWSVSSNALPLPHRDYLVENFLIYLIILLNISVSSLNRGSRENHPSLQFLPCLLSRLKLVAVTS